MSSPSPDPAPEFASRPALVQRVEFLRRACRGRDVLHLGCTNWPYQEASAGDDRFVHDALLAAGRTVVGIDADADGLDAMRARGIPDLHRGDLERLDDLPLTRTFDVVVAGEVIEHLSNPGLFLRGIRRFLGANGLLVLTTINAYCAFRAATYAARGRGGLNEPVHPDHVAYYSLATLTTLLRRHDLAVVEAAFYDLGREHRPFVNWRPKLVNDFAVRLWPQLADGIVLCCRPA